MSIWCRDSNSQTLTYESPPQITSSGLPPFCNIVRELTFCKFLSFSGSVGAAHDQSVLKLINKIIIFVSAVSASVLNLICHGAHIVRGKKHQLCRPQWPLSYDSNLCLQRHDMFETSKGFFQKMYSRDRRESIQDLINLLQVIFSTSDHQRGSPTV